MSNITNPGRSWQGRPAGSTALACVCLCCGAACKLLTATGHCSLASAGKQPKRMPDQRSCSPPPTVTPI
jgi:hypothetical protein